ncbi:MAG TPA: sulfatase [Vicinamibacteria bacterium]|mgnify:CR=1 FL=1|nr:sulfatase [Vicinamibacteria bacterium]
MTRLPRILRAVPLLSAGLFLHLACGAGGPSPSLPSSAPPAAAPAPKPLNVVVIMTDDQEAVSAREMPRMQSLIAAQGVTFQNAISTTPLCSPSRATVLSGRYAHSHNILSNQPPLGGYGKYRDSGMEGDSLPVWLKSAGYRTAYLGKYTNGYGPGWATKPPGWDDWLAFTEPQAYVNFTFNEDGRDLKSPGGEYQTDYLTTRALEYLRRTEDKDDQPFFLMVAPYAPHNVSKYASRHAGMFSSAGAPRTPAFDEPDVNDKPRHIKRINRFTSAQVTNIDNEYRNSLRALQAVDEMIEKLVQALEAQGELDNTAIIFFSDNGLSTGAHRFTDKTAPYAESLDIPLYIRVPGGPKGITIPHLVANLDLPATIVDWARIPPPPAIEGRSLTPLFAATTPPVSAWRPDILVEYWDNTNPATTLMPTYQGVRVENGVESALYVQHDTREEEYYDFKADPYQMDSAVGSHPAEVNRLNARMKTLAACRGSSCR